MGILPQDGCSPEGRDTRTLSLAGGLSLNLDPLPEYDGVCGPWRKDGIKVLAKEGAKGLSC